MSGVCRGADDLSVVQVEPTHVQVHVVSAQGAGDDPATALAQQRRLSGRFGPTVRKHLRWGVYNYDSLVLDLWVHVSSS